MDEVMNSVSVQIQRVINDAKSNQVFAPKPKRPQSRFRTDDTEKVKRLAERPERNSEDTPSQKIRSS